MTPLAVDLARALFCGLRSRKGRMAVFIAAADESADQGRHVPTKYFFYGGFSAPIDDWDGPFARAWDERVLSGPPEIPYLHVTDLLSAKWRHEQGLTAVEASRRLDEASRVIRSTGSLIPALVYLERDEYERVVRQPFEVRPPTVTPEGKRVPRKTDTLEPDYICFLFYAMTQMEWIYNRYGSEAQKVDFWVEDNGKITRHLKMFHSQLESGAHFINRGYLAPLIGDLFPVPKTRIPAQAADMLAWHGRNDENQALDKAGMKRYWRMLEGGNPLKGARNRYGKRVKLEGDDLRQLADGLRETYESALRNGEIEP